MDEHDILHEFLHRDLTFRDAIIRLQKIGYAYEEAKQLATKWVEDVQDKMASDFNEQMGGY